MILVFNPIVPNESKILILTLFSVISMYSMIRVEYEEFRKSINGALFSLVLDFSRWKFFSRFPGSQIPLNLEATPSLEWTID